MGPIPALWSAPTGGPLLSEPRVVPFDPSGGTLPSTVAPAPEPVEVVSNLPIDSVRITRGTAVLASDGTRLGKVEHVHVNEDGEIVSLSIDPGRRSREHLHIPAGWIAEVTEEAIRLTVDAATARRGRLAS